MNGIKQYILTIICAAVLCILIPSYFSGKSSYALVLKFLCSLFFTVILISPWKDFSIDDYDLFWESALEDAKQATDEGVTAFNQLQAAGITERTKAYILDKAKEFHLDLNVQVELDDSAPPTPENIIISGEAAPLQREKLRLALSGELGIPKERILWNP